MLKIHDHDPDTIEGQSQEAHRQAYNAAFDELGLNWQWDAVTYSGLPGSGRERVRLYLQREQAHLLRAYEEDFLIDAIENAKNRCYQVMIAHRSGYSPSFADSRTRAGA